MMDKEPIYFDPNQPFEFKMGAVRIDEDQVYEVLVEPDTWKDRLRWVWRELKLVLLLAGAIFFLALAFA